MVSMREKQERTSSEKVFPWEFLYGSAARRVSLRRGTYSRSQIHKFFNFFLEKNHGTPTFFNSFFLVLQVSEVILTLVLREAFEILGIAAAVMENPDIIILDEPINALDDVSVEKVHDILEEQKKRGAVIIIACHDKEELDQLSDEIIEISDGRIINKTC